MSGRFPFAGVLVAFLLACLPVQADSEQEPVSLTFTTEEYPPFNFLNAAGEIDGISTHLLRTALAELDARVEFRLLPWARAYTEARLRDDYCVYSTTRTSEREDLFQWVGPLSKTDWTAFALSDRALALENLEQLKGYKVGSFHEDAVGLYVSEQGIPVINASRDSENLQRLKAGIIDVWVTSSLLAPKMAAAEDLHLDALFSFKQTELYLACHPSVDAAFLQRLQEALHRVRSSVEFAVTRSHMLEPSE